MNDTEFKNIRDELYKLTFEVDTNDYYEDNLLRISDVLEVLMNLPHTSSWIPCSKSMPEDDAEYAGRHVINVIVETNKGLIAKVQRIHRKNYDGVYDRWSWGRIFGDVIAWQPLPERYKGE